MPVDNVSDVDELSVDQDIMLDIEVLCSYEEFHASQLKDQFTNQCLAQVARIPVTDSGFGLVPVVWETGLKLSCCSSEIGLFSMSLVSLRNTAVSTLFYNE
jgi:hypothetical protein